MDVNVDANRSVERYREGNTTGGSQFFRLDAVARPVARPLPRGTLGEAREPPSVAGDLAGIRGVLADAGVDFIVIGGLAAQAYGSARLTQDVDVVYRRTPENIARLCVALRR